VIAQEKRTRKLTHRELLELRVRQLIGDGVQMEKVSERLDVGFTFIRQACRDMPGAAQRDQVGKWLPDDDEANTSRLGIGYWVPNPEQIEWVLWQYTYGGLKISNAKDRERHDAQQTDSE
jgi:hypothetical protein